MRSFTAIVALGVTMFGLAPVWPDSPEAGAPAKNEVPLMGTLAEWTYPGSRMLGGASMSDGGNPVLQSIKCQAILVTADPVDKVLEFYSKKNEASRVVDLQDATEKVKRANARSVSSQDDSQGRPLTVRVLMVNKADTSTTLVISRAQDEKETHIAWSHYLRVDGSR